MRRGAAWRFAFNRFPFGGNPRASGKLVADHEYVKEKDRKRQKLRKKQKRNQRGMLDGGTYGCMYTGTGAHINVTEDAGKRVRDDATSR